MEVLRLYLRRQYRSVCAAYVYTRLGRSKAESDLRCLRRIDISFVIVRYLLLRLFSFISLYIPPARFISFFVVIVLLQI